MQTTIHVPQLLEAIKHAGDIFLQEFKKNPIPQNQSVFLERLNAIETRCLSLLKSEISSHYPQVPWAGSEFDFEEQASPLNFPEYWICDSMDGAIQYLQHLPGWTINLALVRDGKVYFAAIYDALSNEMFWAVAGQGAYLNTEPIRSSTKTTFKDMLAVFEYTHHTANEYKIYQKIASSVGSLIKHFGTLRNYGPHGLQLAYVGAGRIDFFHQEDLDTYNWLSGILIAQEAGAEILTTDGTPWSYGKSSLMVASPGIGKQFLALQSSPN